MRSDSTAALILVVGANDETHAKSMRILSEAGLEVIEAFSEADAVNKAHSERPDLILLDGELNDVNSLELCAKLKNNADLQGTLILKSFAAEENTNLINQRNGSADNYLFHPVTPEQLVTNVKVLLRLGVVERELREADQRQDKFLMALAHELRNPLAPILNSVELLGKLSADISTPHKKALNTIKRQVQHVTDILDDLSDVSQISQGKTWCDWESVELKAFVNHAVETTASVLSESGHTLSLTLPKQHAWVHGDQIRLSQIVTNLLLHAIKRAKPGSELNLIANVIGQQIQIRLLDKPIATPLKDDDLIMHQGDLAIGVALVQTLAELHGGYLRVYSATAERGNVYEVTLPIDMAASARLIETPPRGHKRILVVDDNADVADTLAQWLKLGGHLVETAYTGAEAIKSAAEFEPEIVLLDISLPDFNGFEVAKRLRELPNLKKFFVVAVTGYGHESAKKTYLERGFDEHFIKPMGVGKLRSIGINM